LRLDVIDSLALRRRGSFELLQERVGLVRDLLPRREHDAISVPARNAPLLVVVFVIRGVVVPTSTIDFEDRSSALEAEVVAVSASDQKTPERSL